MALNRVTRERAKALLSGSDAELADGAAAPLAKRLEAIYGAVVRYLPRGLVREKAGRKKALQKGVAAEWAFLLADVTGFTPLTESLTGLGKEGAEKVTDAINGFFTPILDIIESYGGDVAVFGGDAMEVLFRGADPKDRNLRAARTAVEIEEFAKGFPGIKTSLGSFPLDVHTALHAGEAVAVEVGDPEVAQFSALYGKEITKLHKVEDRSAKGVVCSSGFLKPIGPDVNAKEVARGIYRISGVKADVKPSHTAWKPDLPKGAAARVARFVELLEGVVPHLGAGVYEKVAADPGSPALWGEHRRVSTIFVNFGNLDYRAGGVKTLSDFFSGVQEVVSRYDGTVDKLGSTASGDTVMLLFGAPRAHEDDEVRAARTAFELMMLPAVKKQGLALRVGVSTGYVFAGNLGSPSRHEYTVMGDAVNLAARLCAAASAGEVLVSDSTASRLRGAFGLKKKAALAVKGKKGKVKVHSLGQPQAAPTVVADEVLGESERIIGRDKELKKIRKAVAVASGGKMAIVSLVGEAGVGKSRLTRQTVQLAEEAGLEVLSGNCQSYGTAISYLPWTELYTQLFGFGAETPRAEKKKAVSQQMTEVDDKLANWFPIIGEVLGLDFPQTDLTRSLDAKLRKQRLLDITLQLLSHRAKKQPLCLVFEDLHWADSGSLELITYLGRNMSEFPVLMLAVYRPVEEEWEFTQKDWHTELSLKELSPEAVVELIGSLLGVKTVPDELKDAVLTKTQGNPFYTEEVLKALLEQGAVTRKGGELVLATDVSKLNIPDTVQGVLVTRMDKLPEETKQIMQVAAVLGREFEYSWLNHLLPNRSLSPHLDALRRLDLILMQAQKYMFKHVMTQEVAYDTLAFGRRRTLHNDVGIFLEDMFDRGAEELLGLLAYHFYKGEEWERGFYYAVEAGDRAKRAYANLEALNYYDQALEILDKMSDEQLEEILARIKKYLAQEEAKEKKKAKAKGGKGGKSGAGKKRPAPKRKPKSGGGARPSAGA